ncbi:MAG: polysaccharide deacetylase family protein [Gemmatimonadaceae bacterium]
MYRYRLVSTVAFAVACNSSDPGYVPPVNGRTVAVSQLASSNQAGVQVAITVDDLPWSEPSANAEIRSTANTRLIHTLRQRRAPASLFVNCAKAGNDIPILKEWLAQGFDLGNHTVRHLSIDQAGAAAWLEDVRACDIPLRALIETLMSPSITPNTSSPTLISAPPWPATPARRQRWPTFT